MFKPHLKIVLNCCRSRNADDLSIWPDLEIPGMNGDGSRISSSSCFEDVRSGAAVASIITSSSDTIWMLFIPASHANTQDQYDQGIFNRIHDFALY